MAWPGLIRIPFDRQATLHDHFIEHRQRHQLRRTRSRALGKRRCAIRRWWWVGRSGVEIWVDQGANPSFDISEAPFNVQRANVGMEQMLGLLFIVASVTVERRSRVRTIPLVPSTLRGGSSGRQLSPLSRNGSPIGHKRCPSTSDPTLPAAILHQQKEGRFEATYLQISCILHWSFFKKYFCDYHTQYLLPEKSKSFAISKVIIWQRRFERAMDEYRKCSITLDGRKGR